MANSILLGLLFPLVLTAGHAYAESEIKIHGTLYKVICEINNDRPVDVSFGNVGVSKIDGIRYTQPITLSITCDEAYTGALTFTVTGSVASFDNSAIQTDVSDLGIRIMQNGEPITLNQSFSVNTNAPPALTAVPVTTPGSSLIEGNFHATATLVAEVN